MELLNAISKKEGCFNIREFFHHNPEDINLHHTQITLEDNSWKGLKEYWLKTIATFTETNPSVKVINNSYKVDWEELFNTREIKMSRKRLRSAVAQSFKDATNDTLEESNSLFNGEPAISNIVITNKIKSVKKRLTHEPILSKKDLLYYNILDFVSKNKENGTRRALGVHFNRFATERHQKLKRNKAIAKITNKIFDGHPNLSLKARLKEVKRKIRGANSSDQRNWEKDIIKALKVYQHFFQEANRPLSEDEYLYLLIRPLLKLALKDVQDITMICGEKSLRCAAKRANKKLYDEERRGSGPNIDMIFTHLANNQELAILELSGPINKSNHTHFLEDRCKIAINMKAMLKTLIKSVPPCSVHHVQSLRLYSFQVHDGVFYIYSMLTYDYDHFIFHLEWEFNIPVIENTLEPNCATFFSKLWIIKDLLVEVNNNVRQMYQASRENNMLSSNSEEDSTPGQSPAKKQKPNNRQLSKTCQ